MNLGPGDIVKSIELALAIYQYGFVEENAAGKLTLVSHVRYRNFQEDIFNFRRLLQRLDQSLRRAQRRYLDRGPTFGDEPHEPLSEDLESERKAIVGNFLATLKDCDELLKQNRRFRAQSGQRTRPLRNLQWNFTQQEQRVDDLRRRLHLHTEKVRFVIDRLQLDLLTDADAKADDVIGLVEQNLQLSDDILFELSSFRSDLFGHFAGQAALQGRNGHDDHFGSASVAARFAVSLLVNAPANTSNGVPLVQGFDALLLHFQDSIKGLDHTPEKYLLFLKARWILGRIQEGEAYRTARPGFYYKRAINQVEKAIKARARRGTELIAYAEAVLLDLPDSCFLIWPQTLADSGSSKTQTDQLMPRANEQQLLRLELLCDDTLATAFVMVFKSSNTHMRVVQEILYADQRTIIPQQVDSELDTLIPRYAQPNLEAPLCEMAIFSRNEESLYRFKSLSDLHQFQAAFTGYDISFDHQKSNVRCQFINYGDKDASLDCTGRVQLWQDPIVPDGLDSPTFASDVSSGSATRDGSFLSTAAVSTTVKAISGGWEARATRLPAMAIFTQLDQKKGTATRFAALFVELQSGIYIQPKECRCHVEYDKCAILILGRGEGGKTSVRVCSSDVDAEGHPNPTSFDIFPLRLPKGASYSALPVRQADYIVLKFANLAEKRTCHQELELRFKIRDKQIEDQRALFEEFRRRQDRPERRDRASISNTAGRKISNTHSTVDVSPSVFEIPVPRRLESASPRVELPAPRVALPDTGPSLGDSILASSATAAERRESSRNSLTPISTSTSSTRSTAMRSSAATSVDPASAGTSPPSHHPSLQRPGTVSRLTKKFRKTTSAQR